MKKQSQAFRIGFTAVAILVLAAVVIGIIGLIAGWQGSTRFSDAFSSPDPSSSWSDCCR